MTQNNDQSLISKYGDNSNFENKRASEISLLSQTRNNFTTQKLIDDEQISLANAKLPLNHKNSVSTSKLNSEDQEVRREEKYTGSNISQTTSKKTVYKDKGFSSTMPKNTCILVQQNQNMKAPEAKFQSFHSSGSKECKSFY